jgi:putative SOS response-associated peptidase YedK
VCGRFAFFQEIEPLLDDLDAVDLTSTHLPDRWNVPPTTPIYVVTESADKETGEVERALRIARWGLLPSFAKDESVFGGTFNARRETIAQKASFRGSLGKYRAIVPVSGYFEWMKPGPDAPSNRKQPFFISDPSGDPLYLAGLVSWWKGPGNHEGPAASEDRSWLLSCTIITREATGTLARIHDRTPVMLTTGNARAWLDTSRDTKEEARAFLQDDARVRDGSDLEQRPVGSAVGNTRSQGPELIEREEPGTLL